MNTMQTSAASSGTEMEPDDVQASYLPSHTSTQAGERWGRIQAEFVDDPRRSLSDAHALVSEMMQEIVDGFSRERDALERQWASGDDVSTEELRLCLQRYREFFSRLLPSTDGVSES